ncbi:unnamed protein product [Umbelopsis ramanniana]
MTQPVHSVLFDSNADSNAYYNQPAAASGDNLQFYSSSYGDNYNASPSYYANAAPGPPPNMQSGNNFDYSRSSGSFWSAFGTGGFDDEPPLMEELGVNFQHIRAKSMAVLNPFKPVPSNIMDNADMAGPLLFILMFGVFLRITGKSHFGYIYGVGVLGMVSIFLILNMMSQTGIDWSRTASVLGYCLLPMVMLSGFSVVLQLGSAIGFILSVVSILWCTFSSSGMFTSVLHMSEQRFLVAYPVGLFYACFALMTVF